MKLPAIALALTVSWYLMESPYNPQLQGDGHFYHCVASDDPELSAHEEYPKLDGAPLWRWDTLAVFDNRQDCDQAAQFQFFDSFIRNQSSHPSTKGE